MSRLADLSPDDFDADQRRLYDGIVNGKRASDHADDFLNAGGGMRGPFNALIRAPGVGEPAHLLGEALRYGGKLPGPWRELGILVVAQTWKAQYEWWAHAKIARREGLPEAVIKAVKAGRRPDTDDAALLAIYDFATTLLNERRVPDELYTRAVEALGEAGVAELNILLGYYTIISMTLNVFEVPLAEGEEVPFPI